LKGWACNWGTDEMIGKIRDIWQRLKTFKNADPPEKSDDEALRREFKLRYMQFRRLLNANDKALKTISEMDAVLVGAKPFGMSFIRSRAALLFVNVFQIIQHLNTLADGRHQTLFDSFTRLKQEISPLLEYTPGPDTGPAILELSEIDKTHVEAAGVKMASLGDITKKLNVEIPPGFVITASAYHRFMRHNRLHEEINQRIQSHDGESLDQMYRLSSILQQLVMQAPVPEDVASEIQEAVKRLASVGMGPPALAVRSSGVNEDLPGASFAGQYRSLLNVNPEHIISAYKEVVAGKYNVTAMSYRFNRGLRDEDIVMCVGCLKMVEAVCGGVLYTRNPIDIRDETVIINSVWGLPKLVVDGRSATDRIVVSRKPFQIVSKDIAPKKVVYQCHAAEGICRETLDDVQAKTASLTDDQALNLARLAVAIEQYYGDPQDIEWAIDAGNKIVILQCRSLAMTPAEGKDEQSVNETTRGSSADLLEEDAQDRAGDEGLPSLRILLRGGITASRGVGAGPVHILRKEVDNLSFAAGEVMVIRQSLPGYAVLLDRAAAVIAEYGSISSHLANVAREYEVPVIFGVKGAMDALENGHTVTVDADGLKVYDGKAVHLLKKKLKNRHMMADTPVYNILKQVVPHVSPLNLLNPDSPGFSPENCRSLHDIIRYCHEKAVHEMFRFGRKHEFPERSSKQLVAEVPMQWWILNLDDGFAEEVDGPKVRLDNITSIPMLALWEGINRVPWGGPPPIDAKGFMSVMFEATRNTALLPDMRSRYNLRNYFMIARNYCSLTSRFGFHFATVESYVGERIMENYAIFRFKGGAADDFRKIRRIQLITEILEDVSFRVAVTEDALSARFEDYPIDIMKNRLNILGYLIMHTRQLDMVMSNSNMVGHYRSKIRTDIERLFSPQQL
jgi:pyruvate, water dikinase